ncbi:hypothetical protein JZU68_07185, partial [bacterium]|nr:hypothetical protein [bacterium]
MKIFKSKSYSLTLLLMCLLFASISVLFAQNDGPAPKREISKIEFLGWDYTKVGYTLNPGEKTSLLFQNNTDKIINFPVKWTLKTYMGDSLTSGSTTLNLKGGTVGEVPFKMPSNIKDGAYMIYYYPVTDGWRDKNLFYFDYRKPTNDNSLNINIVACIENMDTEGWARMMMGPLAKFANITNEFPEDMSTVDVAIVVAEALDIFSPKFAKIQQYLAQGGTIIVYGKTAP